MPRNEASTCGTGSLVHSRVASILSANVSPIRRSRPALGLSRMTCESSPSCIAGGPSFTASSGRSAVSAVGAGERSDVAARASDGVSPLRVNGMSTAMTRQARNRDRRVGIGCRLDIATAMPGTKAVFGRGLLAVNTRVRAHSGLSREKRTLMGVKLAHTRSQLGAGARQLRSRGAAGKKD